MKLNKIFSSKEPSFPKRNSSNNCSEKDLFKKTFTFAIMWSQLTQKTDSEAEIHVQEVYWDLLLRITSVRSEEAGTKQKVKLSFDAVAIRVLESSRTGMILWSKAIEVKGPGLCTLLSTHTHTLTGQSLDARQLT